MKRVCFIFGLLLAIVDLAALTIQYRPGAANLVLGSRDARQQLLAIDLAQNDLTPHVEWSAEPTGIVRVDSSGRVSPVADGSATILAKSSDGTTATLPVVVTNFGASSPVHFGNQVVPIFTKLGCNGGGCHGKASGQNGFRLSLLGFEPAEDFEHLLKEARGRRLFPAAPERSLLLTKATAEVPHGGGKRLEIDSDDYNLLVRWLRQGMPAGDANAPTVARIEIFPSSRVLSLNSEQQLTVTARYSDGTADDVTRGVLYEPNDKDLAAVDPNGRVRVFNQPGEFSVMVRYQGKVATFRGTVPLGAPVETLPPARNFVDEQIFAQLRRVGIPPSPVADDSTFQRRVTLDIAGRLPTADEVDHFRANSSPGKRDEWIDQLLASSDYADYFANKWSAILRNKRTDPRHARGTFAFHGWIRDSLAENKPYDQFAREILTASGDLGENPPVAWYRQVRNIQTQLEDVSQLFLGQRLQCAQCHHHPYEKWSQADYWSFGAFFSKVAFKPGSQPGEDMLLPRRGEAQATNKKTGQPVKPAGLAQAPLALSTDDDPRLFLADWLAQPENPWFAKMLVNRYWKHFFGRGLVEPEDDLRDSNPATHPELLDALAAHFVASGFDLKELVRTLVRSTAYQLSAEPNEHNARDRHQFSRFYPRRLPAEVLYDSVNSLVGKPGEFEGMPSGTRAVCLPDNSFNASSYFLTVFGRPESSSACECERTMEASLSQSLHLLNSKDIQARLAADGSRAAIFARASSADTAHLAELYRLAYARDPSPAELELAAGYIAKKAQGKTPDELPKERRQAWEDLIWAMLNSKEFLFNH